jgi:hypothetical protein
MKSSKAVKKIKGSQDDEISRSDYRKSNKKIVKASDGKKTLPSRPSLSLQSRHTTAPKKKSASIANDWLFDDHDMSIN